MWNISKFAMPPPQQRRELVTDFQLRNRRGTAILLVVGAVVAFFAGPDSGGAARWRFAAVPFLAVFAVVLWIWSTWAAKRREILPALTAATLDATVVEVTVETYRKNEDSAHAANRVSVEGDYQGTRWKATIADVITEPSLSRFEVGSHWRVKGFEGNPDWVRCSLRSAYSYCLSSRRSRRCAEIRCPTAAEA